MRAFARFGVRGGGGARLPARQRVRIKRTSATLAPLAPDRKAWMPRSCRSSVVDVASTLYPRSRSGRRGGTISHRNSVGTQGIKGHTLGPSRRRHGWDIHAFRGAGAGGGPGSAVTGTFQERKSTGAAAGAAGPGLRARAGGRAGAGAGGAGWRLSAGGCALRAGAWGPGAWGLGLGGLGLGGWGQGWGLGAGGWGLGAGLEGVEAGYFFGG
jgi:hypothetical protein